MSLAIRLMAEPVRTVAFGAIGAPYSTVGAPMTKPIRMMILQNFTDTAVMLSFDGVHDHLPMVTNGYLILDITSNKTLPQGFFFGEGQQVYVKLLGAPAASGSFNLSVFYGADV